MRNGSQGRRQAGFTYLGLLITLAIIALAGAATLQLGSVMQRRIAEEELLNIGAAYQEALEQYARATPLGQPDAPRTLQDLLKDPRYPGTRRYLRHIYIDPLTGRDDWGLIRSPENQGIVGIFSQSPDKPLKLGNFAAEFVDFNDKTSYQQWKFVRKTQPTAPSVRR